VTHRAADDAPFAPELIDELFAKYASGSAGGATVLVARDGKVLVDESYGVPAQPRHMPTTTMPQFPLGEMSRVFDALCTQLPAPSERTGAGAGAGRTGVSMKMTPLERCVARTVARPVGLHRTRADSTGQVWSNVDELYRLALGLEDSDTWPDADVGRGWTSETRSGFTWLSAYALPGGKRSAFVRIPERRATVIVLTNDDAADAKGIAERIAEPLVSGAR
jgi:hypothetical protein